MLNRANKICIVFVALSCFVPTVASGEEVVITKNPKERNEYSSITEAFQQQPDIRVVTIDPTGMTREGHDFSSTINIAQNVEFKVKEKTKAKGAISTRFECFNVTNGAQLTLSNIEIYALGVEDRPCITVSNGRLVARNATIHMDRPGIGIEVKNGELRNLSQPLTLIGESGAGIKVEGKRPGSKVNSAKIDAKGEIIVHGFDTGIHLLGDASVEKLDAGGLSSKRAILVGDGANLKIENGILKGNAVLEASSTDGAKIDIVDSTIVGNVIAKSGKADSKVKLLSVDLISSHKGSTLEDRTCAICIGNEFLGALNVTSSHISGPNGKNANGGTLIGRNGDDLNLSVGDVGPNYGILVDGAKNPNSLSILSLSLDESVRIAGVRIGTSIDEKAIKPVLLIVRTTNENGELQPHHGKPVLFENGRSHTFCSRKTFSDRLIVAGMSEKDLRKKACPRERRRN